MIKNVFRNISCVLIFLSLLALTSCKEKKNEETTKLQQILEEGKLTVGTCGDFPPFEFYRNGNIEGSDIELAKEIADILKVKLVIKDMPFDDIIPAVANEEIDLGISCILPSEERKALVDFSDTYYKCEIVTVTHIKNEKNFKNQNGNFRKSAFGVLKDSVAESTLNDFIEKNKTEDTDVKIIEYKTIKEIMQDLNSCTIDAAVVEKAECLTYLEKNPFLVMNEYVLATEKFGSAVAMKKGCSDFKELLDTAIIKLTNKKRIEKFIGDAAFLYENP